MVLGENMSSISKSTSTCATMSFSIIVFTCSAEMRKLWEKVLIWLNFGAQKSPSLKLFIYKHQLGCETLSSFYISKIALLYVVRMSSAMVLRCSRTEVTSMYDWEISLFMCQADSVVSSLTSCKIKGSFIHLFSIRTDVMRVMFRHTIYVFAVEINVN